MLLFHYTKGTLIATKEKDTSLYYIEEDRYVRNKLNICLKPGYNLFYHNCFKDLFL